jgi:putative Holliday junction resolvase
MNMPRVLALDLGNKRIGVAISCPLRLLALGHTVLQRNQDYAELNELEKIITDHDVSLLLVGLPKNMNNSIGEQGELTLKYVDRLRERFPNLEIKLYDERLSSKQAHNLLREGGLDVKKRKQHVDMVAATLILQSYLDGYRRG